jgi:hypothetical protein
MEEHKRNCVLCEVRAEKFQTRYECAVDWGQSGKSWLFGKKSDVVW